jgi:hypothetical protein
LVFQWQGVQQRRILMYIGGGLLGAILVIALIFYVVRRI